MSYAASKRYRQTHREKWNAYQRAYARRRRALARWWREVFQGIAL